MKMEFYAASKILFFRAQPFASPIGCKPLRPSQILRFLVTSQVTLPNYRATSIAHSGVALPVWACYLGFIEPPLRCCGRPFGGEI